MVIGVIANLMALSFDPLHQCRVILQPITHQKESGVDAAFFQSIQQTRRVLRRGPIIKGQRHISGSHAFLRRQRDLLLRWFLHRATVLFRAAATQ